MASFDKGLKVRSDKSVQMRDKSCEIKYTPLGFMEVVAESDAAAAAEELEGLVVAERRLSSVVRWSRTSR